MKLPWWLIGIRSWWDKPGRTASIALAIALGVGSIVWIYSTHHSLRRSIEDQVNAWMGSSQISIEPPFLGRIPASLLPSVAAQDNVAVAAGRVKYPWYAVDIAALSGNTAPEEGLIPIDVLGIDPKVDYDLRTFRSPNARLSSSTQAPYGRLLSDSDVGSCMIEESLAQILGVAVGDRIALARGPSAVAVQFEVVGRFAQRRIAKFQRPDVVVRLTEAQALTDMQSSLHVIDITLKDDKPKQIAQSALGLRKLLDEADVNGEVRTADSRLGHLDHSRNQSDYILAIVSGVVLLVSFFIIVTSMSMGMIEKLSHLGMMRCVGFTRFQLGLTTLCEIVPLGVIGVAIGIPFGVFLTWLSVLALPEYLQDLVIHWPSMWLAGIGGFLTTVASGLIPAIQAAIASPLNATRSQSKAPRPTWYFLAFFVGLLILATNEAALSVLPRQAWLRNVNTTLSVFAYFGGYALMTPLIVRFVGQAASYLVAGLLGLRRRLLRDQITTTPWRSGIISCGFMTMLAMVVCISIHAESLLSSWNFPQQIPEAFVWMRRPVKISKIDRASVLPGVKDVVAVNNFICWIKTADRSDALFDFIPKSTFVGVDIKDFLELTELEYLEGDPEQVREKMIAGGHIIVPHEGAQIMGLHVDEAVIIRFGRKEHEFKVAGIVRSPSLDIAARYFQAEHQVLKASMSAVIGTLADAQEYFGVEHVYLALLNLDLPQIEASPPLFDSDQPLEKVSHEHMAQLIRTWQPYLPQYQDRLTALIPQLDAWQLKSQQWSNAGGTGNVPLAPPSLLPLTRALRDTSRSWHEQTPLGRFKRFCEYVVLQDVMQAWDRPSAVRGSIRQLKEDIDNDLRDALRIITVIPLIGLIVAAIGAGNLMMASVAAKTRQLALLRAIGATQGQISRLVLAEALILGLLGTGMGVLLGWHMAININEMTQHVWGIQPHWTVPWPLIVMSVLMTLSACLIAGYFPARFAARQNIIAAMSVT